MSKDRTWTPGCGRHHPDFDLIVDWANGNIRQVAVMRAGIARPTVQPHPCWNPQHDYAGVSKLQEFIRTFRVDGETHSITCRDGNIVGAERGVYQRYGTVEWQHDWVEVQPTQAHSLSWDKPAPVRQRGLFSPNFGIQPMQ